MALPGVRELVVELHQRDARIVLLVGARERHAELQETVGRLGSARVALVALGKGRRRIGVFAAHVKALAQPILGIAGQRIGRILLDEVAQRVFGRRIVGPSQQTEGGIVLGRWRARRQGLRRRAGRKLPALAVCAGDPAGPG